MMISGDNVGVKEGAYDCLWWWKANKEFPICIWFGKLNAYYLSCLKMGVVYYFGWWCQTGQDNLLFVFQIASYPFHDLKLLHLPKRPQNFYIWI